MDDNLIAVDIILSVEPEQCGITKVLGETYVMDDMGATITVGIVIYLRVMWNKYSTYRDFKRQFIHTVEHEVLHHIVGQELGLFSCDEQIVTDMANYTHPPPMPKKPP